MTEAEIDLFLQMCYGSEAARLCLATMHATLFDLQELAIYFLMDWKVIVAPILKWPLWA